MGLLQYLAHEHVTVALMEGNSRAKHSVGTNRLSNQPNGLNCILNEQARMPRDLVDPSNPVDVSDGWKSR